MANQVRMSGEDRKWDEVSHLRYLTGKKRAKLYAKFPPAKIIVIPNKVDFLGFGSPAMEFAWFVWKKGIKQTTIVWADTHDADVKRKRKNKV